MIETKGKQQIIRIDKWDDISKLCFLSSLSGIAVLGDIIRGWFSVNLIIIFLLINIAIMVLKMWMKVKIPGAEN